MGLISRLSSYVNGTVADANAIQAEFDQIISTLNGNLDNANLKNGATDIKNHVATENVLLTAPVDVLNRGKIVVALAEKSIWLYDTLGVPVKLSGAVSTPSHNSLANRNDPNAHSVAAITGLDSRLTAAETAGNDAYTLASGFGTRLTAAESSVAQNQTDINDLFARVGDSEDDITNLETNKRDIYNSIFTNGLFINVPSQHIILQELGVSTWNIESNGGELRFIRNGQTNPDFSVDTLGNAYFRGGISAPNSKVMTTDNWNSSNLTFMDRQLSGSPTPPTNNADWIITDGTNAWTFTAPTGQGGLYMINWTILLQTSAAMAAGNTFEVKLFYGNTTAATYRWLYTKKALPAIIDTITAEGSVPVHLAAGSSVSIGVKLLTVAGTNVLGFSTGSHMYAHQITRG